MHFDQKFPLSVNKARARVHEHGVCVDRCTYCTHLSQSVIDASCVLLIQHQLQFSTSKIVLKWRLYKVLPPASSLGDTCWKTTVCSEQETDGVEEEERSLLLPDI